MSNFKDTYFLNSEQALKTAKQNNKFLINNRIESTQLCYYDGLKIEDAPRNCINVPRKDIVTFFSTTKYRFPANLSFGLNMSQPQAVELTKLFQELIGAAKTKHKENILAMQKKISTLELDFSEKLRVFVPTCRETTVMRYLSQSIADIFQSLGYEVLYYLQGDLESCSMLPALQAQYDFNPHVIIDINNFNCHFFNKDVFNFMWLQDDMPYITNDKPMHLKERDYILLYTKYHKDVLLKKGVTEDKIYIQDLFPVNENEFFLDKSIKREDKIIFVGSYYKKERASKHLNEDIDRELIYSVEKGIFLTTERVIEIFKNYGVDLSDDTINNRIYINEIMQGYNRNTVVSWLAEIENMDVSIYGYDWELSNNQNIIDKYKGPVDKKDLNALYNSSKYILSVSGRVINTQRLGEIVFSGAIPVMYDSREITDEKETWDSECVYFKTKEELKNTLQNNVQPKKYRSEDMLDFFSYKRFAERIENIVNTYKNNLINKN